MPTNPGQLWRLFKRLHNFVRNMRTRGLTDTIGLYSYRVREVFRERKLGISTATVIPWHELGADSERHSYVPVDYDSLDAILDYLKCNIEFEQSTLLDYGCGMGRVLSLAAMYPFRRIIGVEIVPDLIALAQENLKRQDGERKCGQVEIVNTDAADFVVPSEVNIVFLFNPFGRSLLDRVQENISRSLANSPRDLVLIYAIPLYRDDSFAQLACLDLHCELPTAKWKDMRIIVYNSRHEFAKPESSEMAV